MICSIWPQNDGVITIPEDIGKAVVVSENGRMMREAAFRDLTKSKCG